MKKIIILLATASSLFAGEVLPNGSYSYSVDIQVPPGTNGMQPKLSLSYNSNGTNGMVGIGWSLQGFQSIGRINNGHNINYDNNDTYASQGGRLVDISGNHTNYHTEIESFSRYQPVNGCGFQSSEPCSWVVTDGAGTKMYFGSTDNSRVPGLYGGYRVWMLDKVMDLNGNYYTIEYTQDSGDIYPKRIGYTLNDAGGINRYRTVEFNYISGRSDYITNYSQGVPVTTKLRLDSIIVKTNVMNFFGITIPLTGDQVRRYQLTFGDSLTSGRGRLVSVQEFGSDDTSALPPQIFTWSDGDLSGSFEPQQCTPNFGVGTTSPFTQNSFVADFNGDGRADIAAAAPGGTWCVQHGNGTTFDAEACASGGVNPITPITQNTVLGDFNGDGKMDVAAYGGGNSTVWCVQHGNGGAFDTQLCMSSGIVTSEPIIGYILLGDFNGDGRTDIASQAALNVGVWCVQYGNSSSFDPKICLNSGLITNFIQDTITGDFNGDGKLDIAGYAGNQVWCVQHGSVNGFDSQQCAAGGVGTAFPITKNILVADFNGDGKIDIASFGGGQVWCVQHGNSQAFDPQQCMGTGVGVAAPISDYSLVGDFNGDGKADLAAYAGPPGFGTWCVQHGNGTSFDSQQCMNQGVGLFGTAPTSTIVGDFNGDGRTDVASYHLSTTWCVQHGNASSFAAAQCTGSGVGSAWPIATYASSGDVNADSKTDVIAYAGGQVWCVAKGAGNNRYDLLTAVTNSQGGQTYINYDFAINIPNAILPQFSSYPQVTNKSMRQLVTAVSIVDGRNSAYTTFYQYFNGKFNSGTIGNQADMLFEWTKEVKPDSQITQKFYDQSNQYTGGSLVRERQFDANGGMIADIQNLYVLLTPFSGTRFLVAYRKLAQAFEGGVLVHNSSIDMGYDGYGFLSQRTTATTGFAPVVEKLSVINDLNANVFGRTTDIEIYSGSLAGPKIKHDRSVYNGSGATCGLPSQINLVCQKQAWLDKSKNGPENRFITVNNTYSIYGNLLTTTDAINHTTSYAYDPNYQAFPVQTTNAKGQTTTRTYDARFGVVLTETDAANGVTVSQEFDVFGRQIKTYDANGLLVKQHIFSNLGDPNAQFAEMRITDDSADGYQWAREYTDGLGRIYKKEGEGLGVTAVLRADVTFDAVGRKANETNSYVNPGGTPRITNYGYDNRGRIAGITYPEDRLDNSGKVATIYSYGTGNVGGSTTATTTATDAKGNSKTIHKNARGQTVRIDDPLGASVRHFYDEQGRLIQTVDADNNTTTIEYDSIGRKIRMIEPSSGTIVYRYDDAGNLAEQVDGKGQVILFSYDELNRLTLKDLPGSETDVIYEYDLSASTYGQRRLSKVTDAAGTVEYNYDKRGNMSAWKRSIDSYAFSFQATYDAQNRVQETTYPDGYKAHNYFSDAGHIRQVRLISPSGFFGSSLVTYQGPETTGTAEILRNLGNGVITKIGFDDSTHRPNYIRTYLKNDIAFANPVQNLSYAYDDVGNVSQITDNLNAARNESYSYDSLYRLTQATSGMYGTKSYAFTAGGNLTQNGSLQLYYGQNANCTSGGNLPTQAVCADSSGNQYSYDSNGNMTTREGRDLVYDSEDRLKEIKESGVTKLSFVYNHAGERIKKIRPDGAITYSIGGLYEVQKKPDGSEVHTKYFTGIKSDRIAQVTKDSSQVTLVQVTTTSTEIYMASGRGMFMTAMNGMGGTIGYFIARFGSTALTDRGTGHLTIFFLVIIGGLGFVMIRSRGPNAFAYWQRVTVMPALVCFLSVVFIDCSGTSVADNGTTWETTTGSTTGIPPLNTPPQTYNDTTLAGMPITGTFFLVPNHLGSTTLVTDASGTAVVSEMHYEPYGDVVTAHSTGPDIIRNTYTGQVKDVESSLMYYGARYYDPKLGRFISSDSMVPDAGHSQAYNRYMYVAGNPVAFTDPSGHVFGIDDLLIALVVIAVGAIIGGTKGNIKGWLKGEVKFDWGLAGIGALAGAVGFVAGAATVASLGGAAAVTSSLALTMQVGWVAGGYAGFVGASMTAWYSGSSFLEGFGIGILGLAGGALGGAALAGVGWLVGSGFSSLFSEADEVYGGSTYSKAPLVNGKVKFVNSSNAENPDFWDSISDYSNKLHYEPGDDQINKVDLPSTWNKNLEWYGPKSRFRVEEISFEKRWGSRIRISVLDKSGNIRAQVNMIHFTEIDANIMHGYNTGRTFEAGTYLGATRKAIGKSTGAHLHMEIISGGSTRNDLYNIMRGY